MRNFWHFKSLFNLLPFTKFFAVHAYIEHTVNDHFTYPLSFYDITTRIGEFTLNCDIKMLYSFNGSWGGLFIVGEIQR